MDGTGAGSADPTGSAENTAAGTTTRTGSPARPAAPADATGPLPVQLPADATGPLPAGALFTDPTGDRPADEPHPPERPAPAGPETTGLPILADDPAPRTVGPPATGGAFDVFATEPRAAAPATSGHDTGHSGSPAADLFADPSGTGSPRSGASVDSSVDSTGPQGFDVFATEPPGPAVATGPPTAGVPTVGPSAPYPGDPYAADPYAANPYAADPYGADQYTAARYAADPGAADLFAPDPPVRPAADLFTADPPAPPPADLFAADPPSPPPTAPFAAEPPTYPADPFAADPPAYPADPFAADPSAPPPADPFATGPPARATTAQDPAGTTSPSAFTPAVGPADATGPMPLAIPPASATETTQPPAAPPATGPRTPPVEAEPVASVPEASASETTVESVPGTGAWSFAPPASSSGGDAWSFTGERSSGRTQSWPLPAPGGAAHAGASRQSEAPATGRSRKRVAWPLTLVGVLVAVAAGIALTVTLARAEPDELITAAATDVGGWNGVRYQGAVAAADGGRIRFDLTVTVDGATGTLSRDDGQATAEIHRDGSGTVVRANRTWWLYHHPTRADDLANTWVADPLTETQEIEPILQLHPYALASHVRPEQQRAQWTALEEQQVDGRDALVLSDGTRRVVVAAAAPHQLLAVDIGPTGALAPVQVSDVPSEEAAGVGRAAGEIREAEAPKTLTQRLLERPLVEITLEPEPLCVTPSCTVTVTVTNSGSIPAEGRLEVSADGTLVATHPLDVQPGQVATFTATAPNPQFATPGAKGQILWESRAVDD